MADSAPMTQYQGQGKKRFEKSKADKESKGGPKEGSKREEAEDARQMRKLMAKSTVMGKGSMMKAGR